MTIPSSVTQEEWDVFLAETQEQLQALEEAALRLEHEDADPELVREMFRLAHTIKGSSAAVGLESMATLTHSVESLLGQLRDGQIVVNPPLVDALFQGCDLLQRLVLLPTQPDDAEEPPIDPLMRRIEAILSGMRPAQMAGSGSPGILTPLATVELSTVGDGQTTTPAGPSVRIDVQKLDTLMELVGELVIDRERIEQITARWQAASPRTGILRAELADVSLHLRRTLDDLRDEVLQSRMVPVSSVLRRLPRMVRDLARDSGKLVELEIHGEYTELDRAVIEELSDPLTHLVRNSVDHGIELPAVRQKRGKAPAGLISINARPDENQILIELRDDGRGIDVARLREVAVTHGFMGADAAERATDADLLDLIFLPGFSTAEKVTEVSGRGVGMDIVRSRIERVNGSIAVTTVPDEGTWFVIRLPLTLAIIRGLLVTLRQRPYAIPLTAVSEVLRIPREDVRSVGRRPAIELRGEVLPLVWLDELLGLPPEDRDRPILIAVSVRVGGRRMGIVVDGLVGEQDVVIKPIGAFLGKARGIAGATILVDGRVCPILNVVGLLAASSVSLSRADEPEPAATSREGRS